MSMKICMEPQICSLQSKQSSLTAIAAERHETRKAKERKGEREKESERERERERERETKITIHSHHLIASSS